MSTQTEMDRAYICERLQVALTLLDQWPTYDTDVEVVGTHLNLAIQRARLLYTALHQERLAKEAAEAAAAAALPRVDSPAPSSSATETSAAVLPFASPRARAPEQRPLFAQQSNGQETGDRAAPEGRTARSSSQQASGRGGAADSGAPASR